MTRFVILGVLVVGLVAAPATADEWHDRVKKELAKIEKTVGKLDKQKPEAEGLRERVMELDQRVVALAKKAGLKLTPQKVYAGEDQDQLIGSIAQTVMNVKSRLRKIDKAKKSKKDADKEDGAEGTTKKRGESEKSRRSRRMRNIRRVRGRLVREYLRDQEVTTVTTKTSTCGDIEVTAVASFEGQSTAKLVKPVVSFTITSNEKKARFAGIKHVKLTADGRDFYMKAKRNETPLPGTVLEVVTGKVDLRSFAFIAYACDLEFVLKGQSFTATTELQGTLLELAQMLGLDDPYERSGRD